MSEVVKIKVIGFSSGNVGRIGNTDRMVQAILEKSGGETEFVKLADLNYSACKGCVHLCAQPQVCQLDDDLLPYYQKLKEADAVVLGSPMYFGRINAGMMAFVERFFGYRHVTIPIAHKPFALAVLGCGSEQHEGGRAFRDYLSAFRVRIVDTVRFRTSIYPCYDCKRHKECVIGGFYMAEGKASHETDITPEMFHCWEDEPSVVEAVNTAAARLHAECQRRESRLKERGVEALSIDSTLGELRGDEEAKAILEGPLPGWASSPQLEGTTLREIAAYSQGTIADETLRELDEALSKL